VDERRANRTQVGVVEARASARATADDCFALAGSYSVRLEWDPFVQDQRLIGADQPGRGVRTWTRSRHRLTMVTEYVTYRRPNLMGMRMVQGPPLFRTFSGSWHFTDAPTTPPRLDAAPGGEAGPRCDIVFRYRFECRPSWLQWLTHPIGRWYLGRDIDRRLAAFVRSAEDPAIVARAHQEAG